MLLEDAHEQPAAGWLATADLLQAARAQQYKLGTPGQH